SSLNACMRRSQQAFSAPSKQTQSSNAKDELSSTASITASSTPLIPSSELLASKPRDSTLKREQNSCYEHDNGLFQRVFQTDICEFEFSQPSQAVVSSHHLRFSFRLAHSALPGGQPAPLFAGEPSGMDGAQQGNDSLPSLHDKTIIIDGLIVSNFSPEIFRAMRAGGIMVSAKCHGTGSF